MIPSERGKHGCDEIPPRGTPCSPIPRAINLRVDVAPLSGDIRGNGNFIASLGSLASRPSLGRAAEAEAT